jgi:CHAT domain-containing protein
MRWRRLPPAPGRVLALADPTGVPMAALPYARQEASAVARRMNGAAQLVVGAGASEEMLRARDLGGFGVLHLAAHALVDYQRPERSGVLLAGGPEQDGLVQPREIAGLSLSGKLVVLSGCRGASGSLLRGEGVMGLAHAFFQAGARAVVGSLWPLRDDTAAALLDSFYEALARGATADQALSAARAQAIRRGLPASGWAGLEVMGDGGATFTPHASPEPSSPRQTGLLMASLACGAAALLLVASPRRG